MSIGSQLDEALASLSARVSSTESDIVQLRARVDALEATEPPPPDPTPPPSGDGVPDILTPDHDATLDHWLSSDPIAAAYMTGGPDGAADVIAAIQPIGEVIPVASQTEFDAALSRVAASGRDLIVQLDPRHGPYVISGSYTGTGPYGKHDLRVDRNVAIVSKYPSEPWVIEFRMSSAGLPLSSTGDWDWDDPRTFGGWDRQPLEFGNRHGSFSGANSPARGILIRDGVFRVPADLDWRTQPTKALSFNGVRNVILDNLEFDGIAPSGTKGHPGAISGANRVNGIWLHRITINSGQVGVYLDGSHGWGAIDVRFDEHPDPDRKIRRAAYTLLTNDDYAHLLLPHDRAYHHHVLLADQTFAHRNGDAINANLAKALLTDHRLIDGVNNYLYLNGKHGLKDGDVYAHHDVRIEHLDATLGRVYRNLLAIRAGSDSKGEWSYENVQMRDVIAPFVETLLYLDTQWEGRISDVLLEHLDVAGPVDQPHVAANNELRRQLSSIVVRDSRIAGAARNLDPNGVGVLFERITT